MAWAVVLTKIFCISHYEVRGHLIIPDDSQQHILAQQESKGCGFKMWVSQIQTPEISHRVDGFIDQTHVCFSSPSLHLFLCFLLKLLARGKLPSNNFKFTPQEDRFRSEMIYSFKENTVPVKRPSSVRLFFHSGPFDFFLFKSFLELTTWDCEIIWAKAVIEKDLSFKLRKKSMRRWHCWLKA